MYLRTDFSCLDTVCRHCVSDNMVMRIIVITMMTFRMNLTEEIVWVTNAFASRLLKVWNHHQDTEHIYWVSVWLYSAAPYKQSVNNSVPAITPTCTSHSDHLIRSCQYVLLQNVKFSIFFFSPSLLRPDSRHLFSRFSVGQTAGIELWQLASSIERIYGIFSKICF